MASRREDAADYIVEEEDQLNHLVFQLNAVAAHPETFMSARVTRPQGLTFEARLQLATGVTWIEVTAEGGEVPRSLIAYYPEREYGRWAAYHMAGLQ